MNAWNENSLGELQRAVAGYDRPTAQALCHGLVLHLAETDELFPEKDARKILGALRKKRWFDLMQSVADRLILSGQVSAEVQRQFAQSLIDQGSLAAARAVLHDLLADQGIDAKNRAEAQGLLGRVLKQTYADAPCPTSHQKKALGDAVSAYYEVYQAAPSVFTWQGINAVALKLRAARDRVAVDATFDPKKVAQTILAVLESKPEMDAWDLATAAEACIALGQADDALDHLHDYVASPNADAFEIASFLRQLKEIWKIDAQHPLRALPLALEAALLKKEGARVAFEPGSLRDARTAIASPEVQAGLEKVFGAEDSVTFTWYRRALDLARGVARVGNQWRATLGTGFLVRAGDFFPSHRTLPKDELLLLTNAHVLGETHSNATRGAEALVRFDEVASPAPLPVKGLVWESRVDELDATFARIEPPAGSTAFALAPPEEPAFSAASPRRLYIIGHPAGEELSISLHDNLQVGWRAPKLHYRTPTRPGSSGSPVFDSEWRLVALHHAGSDRMPRLDGQPGYYQANEGIWIHSILRRTREVQ